MTHPHIPEEGDVGCIETQTFTFAEPPNEMPLDSGESLGPITLAYETYGGLNEAKSNAILIVHALSGDAHVAGRHNPDDRKPGWWDSMVGPGKAFDTDRFFIICSNVIGGCAGSTGPASLDPRTGWPYGLTFPIITIGDMVRAQTFLIDHLGIPKLLAVAGGSMGGMQALEWAVSYPDRLDAALIIASTHISGAQSIAFDAVGRHAIQADQAFGAGDYYDGDVPARGLSIARMLGHITYLSDASMREKFGRALRNGSEFRYEFASEFSVETYLDYQGEQFVNRFDANSYLYLTKALDYFDISARFGSLDQAMDQVRAKILVLSFSSDWLYPPSQSEEIIYALARRGKDASYCCIQSDYGHDAFLLETEVMHDLISGFLDHAAPGSACCPPGEPACQTGPCPSAQPTGLPRPHRADYDRIVELIPPGSRVLDIGCGDGELLCRLTALKGIRGAGIEVDPDQVVRSIQRGISVIQADIDQGLSALPDQSCDFVILSMTLQAVHKPHLVLQEMLRVGRKCIVSFPNFGHWSVRAQTLFGGRAPITRALPYSWHETLNFHVLSIKDFRAFCRSLNARILHEIPLPCPGACRLWPNLFAEKAVCIIGPAE